MKTIYTECGYEVIDITPEEVETLKSLFKPDKHPHSPNTLTQKCITMKETWYISGRITNAPNQNRLKFEAAEAKVIQMGHVPINPHKLDHSENVFKKWFIYMRVCMAALPTATKVVALDDYKLSRGACIEIWSAEWMNIPVVDLITLEPVKLSFWIKIKLLLNLIK